MTDIERYQHSEVDSWAPMMSDVIKLADYVSDTEFVPKALRGKPPAIAASILAGREAGIPPIRALNHIHMVDGSPSMSAEQKRAQALAAGHEIVFAEASSTRCTVKGRRKGSEHWSTVTWTMDDAKQAKLTEKENWRKHPRRMLEARATGELCDMLFPDATAGLVTYEEVSDGGDAAGVETDGQTQQKPRTAQRRRKAAETGTDSETKSGSVTKASRSESQAAPQATVPEPPLPGEEQVETATEYYQRQPPRSDESESEPEEAEPMITSAQEKKLGVHFRDLGVNDRDEAIHAASVIVGRPLDSRKELTQEEASTLIDTLSLALQQEDPRGYLNSLVKQTQQAEEGSDDA